jgi:hypothetical protein
MWVYQGTWQLTEEPNFEPLVRHSLLVLVIVISVYATVKICLALGLRFGERNNLLNEIWAALEKNDLSKLSNVAKALPRDCPEIGLLRVTEMVDKDNLGGITEALRQADVTFHSAMRRLTLSVELVRSMVLLTFIGMWFWIALEVRAILLGLSMSKHADTSTVAASLNDSIPGTLEFLIVVAVLLVLERLSTFRIVERRLQWEIGRSRSIG